LAADAAAAGAAAAGGGKVSGPFCPQPVSKVITRVVAKNNTSPAATLFSIDEIIRKILVSTSMTDAVFDSLSDAEYQQATQVLLGRIEATADRWLQDDVIDIDTNRTGGLLELSFPGGSKIVINTQPPLHELWLATRGGGFHYRWLGGAWRDTKDDSEFIAVLSAHASLQAGQPLNF